MFDHALCETSASPAHVPPKQAPCIGLGYNYFHKITITRTMLVRDGTKIYSSLSTFTRRFTVDLLKFYTNYRNTFENALTK